MPSVAVAMKIDMNIIPVGLLAEHDVIERHSERRMEIIDHAIRIREQERLSLREVRSLLTWHPLRTTKVVILAGLVTFVLAWVLSELIAMSHWYASARTLRVTVPLPVVGNKVVDLGGYIPTSTALNVVSTFPTYGVRESAYVALGVMGLLLLEKLAVTLWHARESHHLSKRLEELTQETEELKRWRED